MKIEVGSKWRNRRSGVVSEVVRVDSWDVFFRVGKSGERRKFAQHVPLDYELVEEAHAKGVR